MNKNTIKTLILTAAITLITYATQAQVKPINTKVLVQKLVKLLAPPAVPPAASRLGQGTATQG